MKIGLISDTHGLLRPQAAKALEGCAHILHAGDIGGPEIIEALSRIAPLTAVRGNNDFGAWAAGLRDTETVTLLQTTIHVIHDIAQLRLAPGVRAVVSGHSHKPASRVENGVLYVNPGSAGPRRFTLPISMGFLHIVNSELKAQLVRLEA